MTIDLALEKLIPGLQEIYGDLIDSIVLYGSTARGTRTENSDVDVAILLRAGATKVMREQMFASSTRSSIRIRKLCPPGKPCVWPPLRVPKRLAWAIP